VIVPRRLIRTVPKRTTSEQEHLWEKACDLHPAWEHVTLRDPVDPADFPISSPHWTGCETGAQLADLIRLEEVYHRGGVYIDSDVELLRPLDPMLGAPLFAGYQDSEYVCNAVFGASPGHTAILRILKLSIERQHQGTLAAGVNTFSEILHGRNDILLLPPGSFYPYHWTLKGVHNQNSFELSLDQPWAYAIHHWEASWKEGLA